jgi:glycosyltransferase involved in cell wall biosynthesis
MAEETGVDILLATYNGERHLEDQIRSVLGQSHSNWTLFIRDDGSTDGTVNIIDSFEKKYPGKIVVLRDGDGNLGYKKNFSRLLEKSTADYIALCDQDDLWVAEKISLNLDKMRSLERMHGSATPLLVFSDLKVVDEDLEVISESFWKYQCLDPDTANSLNRLLIQNVVTGCTAMINRSLKELSLPIPVVARAHDWWIALVAAAFGAADYIEQPTVLYRQHRENTIGAKSFRLDHLVVDIVEFLADYRRNKEKFLDLFAQADKFLETYSDLLGTEKRLLLNGFLAICQSNVIMRAYYSTKYKCLPNEFVRSLGFILLSRQNKIQELAS